MTGKRRYRLGELLMSRRVELDPRYRTRAVFCRERGVNARVVADLELGRRNNFEDATLRALEQAYGLASGCLRLALQAGGDVDALPTVDISIRSEPHRTLIVPADLTDQELSTLQEWVNQMASDMRRLRQGGGSAED